MTPDTFTTYGGWIGTALAIGVAAMERFRSRRWSDAEHLSKAKDELSRVLGEDRDAWKARYETEHAEFFSYREQAHKAANENNGRMLQMTDEIAHLKEKTDITPLIKYQEAQNIINTKLIQSLESILTRLDDLAGAALR